LSHKTVKTCLTSSPALRRLISRFEESLDFESKFDLQPMPFPIHKGQPKWWEKGEFRWGTSLSGTPD